MNGKITVISSILKIDRPFRIPHITDMTGFDRNLVRYHIQELTKQGYLEKIDKTYVLKDREGLFSSLLEATEKTETAKMKSRGFFVNSANTLSNIAESIVAGKQLDIYGVEYVKTGFIKTIDDSIAELKNLRKYVNNSQKTNSTAAKFFKRVISEGNDEEYWQMWGRYGGDFFNRDFPAFHAELKLAIEGANDE